MIAVPATLRDASVERALERLAGVGEGEDLADERPQLAAVDQPGELGVYVVLDMHGEAAHERAEPHAHLARVGGDDERAEDLAVAIRAGEVLPQLADRLLPCRRPWSCWLWVVIGHGRAGARRASFDFEPR